jgi:hypothetical protein
MIKRVDFLGSFLCHTGDGQDVVVNVFVDIIDAATNADLNAELMGHKSLRTEDGLAVNRVEKGRYEIPATGDELTCDDPSAP